MGKTVGELHAMLIEYEKGLPKKAETPQVMMIKGGKIQKSNKKSLNAKGKNKVKGKEKDKKVYIPQPKNLKPTAMERPAKDDACHHCKEVGHWKRNCPVYLAELIKKKKQFGIASSSDVFIIELFSFPTKSWVYDTSCDNCHYAPSIIRGVVSVHRLVENGFVQRFTDFGISVSKNNVHYFNAIPSNGIYEIDMHNLVPNVNSIYNVSTKRAKHNLDSTYLWHCRLAHISKKRIEKLQQEGLLKSTDDESFDQCVSCLSGKMTRKSFPHRPERATDLLGIIHTDVCGPLRHVSRQGASYFITFIDDYSRYGYVYLLKHKHEVFETFKVFKNEVENQLGKTIKAIRSDRGGEYISQEFKDYLKANGIVQQLTPPYTPQHNGVFERRNRTLLDMVRSMMNLTTLPLSFWDYALESATRFLICNIPQEVEGFEPPQEEVIPIRRSKRPHRAPNRLCLNVEVEEHSLGDLNEPASYKRNVGFRSMQAFTDHLWFVKQGHQDAGNQDLMRKSKAAKYDSRMSTESSVNLTGLLLRQDIFRFEWRRMWIGEFSKVPLQMYATEFEYIAASEAAMEAVWIRKFISGLGIVPTDNEPLNMYCDNSAAVHYANEPGVQKAPDTITKRLSIIMFCECV
ncbi:retrotransposon protein, putative, ty1-copia subclass [Tanacetum coccineum]|uniref:Retrotransposon protein, putative, ty1-copia subclass n=1 Tax=Tanacetum coccineum TaxID=301880 RepID=A0ABQ5HZA8_9ASTR